MQLNVGMVRRYDGWLIAITLLVIVLFLYVIPPFSTIDAQQHRLSDIRYLTSTALSQPISQYHDIQEVNWNVAKKPVNLGMQQDVYWFHFTVKSNNTERYAPTLLEVAYPLIDSLTVLYFTPELEDPLLRIDGGDAMPFGEWAIKHPSMLFQVPTGFETLEVVMRVQTSGAMRLPVRIWNKTEFIEYSTRFSHLMGAFYGFLIAIGVSNFFLFLTTRSVPFLMYTGYVFSLAVTLAALNGQAFAYLWPHWGWLEERAIAIFANAAIMFAIQFSRLLLEVKSHNQWMDRILHIAAWAFCLNIVISLILPYSYLIKVFLIMLALVVMYTLAVGIWMAMRGHTIARYYSFAWSILLFSGLSSSLDNLGILNMPVSSSYLLMLGATVETLLLTFIVAISYRKQREEAYISQQSALQHEQVSVRVREDLVLIQQQYADELEYKVQERTLELEIALRELSEANQELERLNSIDSLTGIRNRRHFDKRLLAESRRSRREQTVLSLTMVDIDFFKSINDKYGHAAGDVCICHVATILQAQLKRPSDDVCRYGGEEFGIILPNTDVEGARQVVEAMRVAVEAKPVYVDGEAIRVTVSAGVASAVVTSEAHEQELLKYADSLLYRAKRNGRNQVVADMFTGESS